MARTRSTQPTKVELRICQALWRLGVATVRQVHEALNGTGAPGYTTTLKMMQVMTGKGLLRRDDTTYPHVFRTTLTEEETQTSYVEDMVTRVFGGAAEKLVMRAVASQRVTRKELGKIRELIRRLEQGDKP
jgi:BlaI family transcriptional regulator, penicillinase repressor